MKIKDIKDPKIQQMAVVNTIAQHPEYELGFIMESKLDNLFKWIKSPQGHEFWMKVDYSMPVNYTNKGLYFKNEFGYILFSDKEILSVVGFTLATPEEVYNHLNPSIVGTTQTVEIDGRKYEVTINQQIQ